MKFICTQCDFICDESELLQAANPFKSDDTVYGCPRCFGIDAAVAACDAPDCTRQASCGTPTPDGYRHTCSEHRPVREAKP